MQTKTLRFGIIAACFFIYLLGWAFSSPVGSSPDDDFHLSSIWCESGAFKDNCQIANGEAGVPVSLVTTFKCFAANGNESGLCQAGQTWNPENRFLTTHGNWNELYPSGFYTAMSVFMTESIQNSVYLIRVINALLLVILIFILVLAVDEKLAKNSFLILFSGLSAMGAFIIPSTNPSSWALTGNFIFFIAFYAFVNDRAKNRALILLISLVGLLMAYSSRVDAFFYSGVAAVAIVAGSKKWRSRPKITFFASVVFVLSVINIIYGPTQGSVATEGMTAQVTSRSEIQSLWINMQNLPSLFAGNYGYVWGLGWLDTQIPISAWLSALAAVTALIILSLGNISFRELLTPVVITTSSIIVPLLALSRTNSVIGEIIQPRYLLPLFFVCYASYVINLDFLRISAIQTVFLATLICTGSLFSLHAQLRRYITGQDVSDYDLSRNQEWWYVNGISPNIYFVLVSIFFITGTYIAFSQLRITSPKTRT